MMKAEDRRRLRPLLGFACLALLSASTAAMADTGGAIPFELWPKPQEPFRIVGNIYYVGSQGLASYLIVTPKGDFLIDGTIARNAPMIERNIRKLGFNPRDVRYLLNTHAHYDHAAGLAQLKRDTGATMLASAGDRWALEHGTHRGDNSNGPSHYPPVKVDRTLHDGEALHLGGTTLTAWLTPGHTPGCTSWAMPVTEAGRTLQVVFPCSISIAGNILVGNHAYPEIATDYRRSFTRLKSMKADIVLTAHPEVAEVIVRHRRQLQGQRDAYVAPHELQRIVSEAESDFDAEMAKERRADSGQSGH